MILKLSKITDIPEKSSGVVLFEDPRQLPFPLSEAEQDLWDKKDSKAEFLLFQRLPGFLFLVSPPMDKAVHQVMERFRRAGVSWMETVKKEKIKDFTLVGLSGSRFTEAFLEGFLLSDYAFTKYKKVKEAFSPAEIRIVDPGITEEVIRELQLISESVCWVRDLVNEPLSYLTAVRLSEEIVEKTSGTGCTVKVFHKPEIEALKMGGLLGVNRGSPDPPTFTVMEWTPATSLNLQPIVLIGKGVVFDTGGLSLKPTPKSMDYMKSDMAGAAVVAAVIRAAALAGLPLKLVGLIPATDNRPDGNALTPGDVITLFDGTTVEVLNTDAEGRLILADALAYAQKYDPLLVIDIATLTGGAAIISGSHGIPAMSNTPDYLQKLKASGEEVYERIIELPLWEEFAASLESYIADMTNLGGREGQTIVAAKFLEHFTAYPWIHLDIAGSAWLFEKEGYRGKGGTGSGTRLLFDFLKRFK